MLHPTLSIYLWIHEIACGSGKQTKACDYLNKSSLQVFELIIYSY